MNVSERREVANIIVSTPLAATNVGAEMVTQWTLMSVPAMLVHGAENRDVLTVAQSPKLHASAPADQVTCWPQMVGVVSRHVGLVMEAVNTDVPTHQSVPSALAITSTFWDLTGRAALLPVLSTMVGVIEDAPQHHKEVSGAVALMDSFCTEMEKRVLISTNVKTITEDVVIRVKTVSEVMNVYARLATNCFQMKRHVKNLTNAVSMERVTTFALTCLEVTNVAVRPVMKNTA